MPYISFNSKTLAMTVVCGPMEEYKPTEDVKGLFEDIKKVKEDYNEFVAKTWAGKTAKQIVEVFKADEKEKEKFNKYIEDVYNLELGRIIERINAVNQSLGEVD